jgi:AraC-like DNA-binding protein
MGFHSHIPSKPLSDFVEAMWMAERWAEPHARERLLPTGSMNLVVGLDDDDRTPGLAGIWSRSFLLDTSRPRSFMGVNFSVGGGAAFFDVPAGELHNLAVPLDALWPHRDVSILRERLLAAETAVARFRVLEETLRERLCGRWLHTIVRAALDALRAANFRDVGAVCERTAMSHRRFIDVFRNQVGLTPKLYCRVRRFQSVLDLLETERTVDWVDLALSGGYFDQAHFIHDFRDFAGVSPSTYLCDRRGRHHVALRD